MESLSLKSDSTTTDNSSNLNISKQKTKSGQFYEEQFYNYMPKEINIINASRKLTYDINLIKNFVPVIRPKKKQKINPSKLILNSKTKASSISQHASEDENDINNDELNLSNSFVNSVISDSSSDSFDEKEIKNTRKNFTKIRKYSMYRNRSKKNINEKNTKDLNDINIVDNLIKKDKAKSDKISIRKENNLKNYVSLKSCQILSTLEKNENMAINKKPRNRMNSFSILEALQIQNNLKFEK